MFYRFKFDSIIGKILAEAGCSTISQKSLIWPAGLSAHLISQGKSMKIDAKTAAYIGLVKYFMTSDVVPWFLKLRLVNSALMCAVEERDLDDSIVTKIQQSLIELEGAKDVLY